MRSDNLRGQCREIMVPDLGLLDSDVGFALVSAYNLTNVTLQFLFHFFKSSLVCSIPALSPAGRRHVVHTAPTFFEFNGPAYNCTQFPLSSLPVNLSQIAAENFDNNPTLQSRSWLGTPPDDSCYTGLRMIGAFLGADLSEYGCDAETYREQQKRQSTAI